LDEAVRHILTLMIVVDVEPGDTVDEALRMWVADNGVEALSDRIVDDEIEADQQEEGVPA
jgi:hypothetical protein